MKLRILTLWICVHAIAALAPFVGGISSAEKVTGNAKFPGWPESFRGSLLSQLELSERERLFIKDFPGKIARFSDGGREIIIRWVEHPTRKLHPAADCLKGAGYKVSPLPIAIDAVGDRWGCVLAARGADASRVCERIEDDDGQGWTDVSSWFWNAVLRSSNGPWWALTVAESV
ncbi:MAG: hypothetical protein KDD66_06805 [Bdellovibrionales bacterium]|nr:hypothetical protein [Bdellovibrionales bacterium]